MKQKLFSIFCCLLLSASMATHAQKMVFPDADSANANPNRGFAMLESDKIDNQPSGIRKNPSAIQSTINIVYKNDYTIGYGWDEEYVYWIQFTKNSDNNVCLQFCLRSKTNKESVRAYTDVAEAPIPGSYPFYYPTKTYCSNSWTISANTLLIFSRYSSCSSYGTNAANYPYPTFWKYNGMQQDKYYWNNTGSVTVAEGHAGKIYVVVNETSNDTYYTDDAYNFTIGEPKYTFNINVATNNASLGTVSKNKSSVTEGGSVTLTANETSGTFQGWSLDGGTTIIAGTNNQLTYSPTLGADAGSNGQTFTYTAVFVPKNAPQYTITTAVSPSNTYGTVTGAGSYYETNPATLTATSANEHLYIFDHWLKDGNNYAGGTTITPTVTANATYTAVFRAAAAGTITGVAAHGTISGTGNYAGGTAVQLGVTPDDGYSFTQWSDGNTDNPRTVYVDGDATYTAQFMYGVSLNLLAGCSPSSPLEYRVLLPDYEIYFRAGNSWSYGDGEEIPLSYINTSASYIKDHGTTVTIGNDVYAYTHTEGDRKILELNFTGSNGKYYQILLRGADYATDCSQDFNQTFTNLTAQSSGTGWRILYADNGVTESAANDMFGPNHWDIYLPVYIDESKCGSANNGVPTGIYPILDTDEDGTIRATISNSQARASGYWTCQGINQMHKLVTGYMDIVNRDGNTYAQIDGYTSSCYPLHCVAKSSSSVTTPFAITCTASEGGTAGIVWHSATCGDVVYDAGTQKFFSGNSITLTATPNSGYEFWRWSDEDASVKTSAYGASRNVTVSGNLTLQAIFRTSGPATYALSWDANGGALVGTAGEDYTPDGDYEAGETIIVPHATREGYHLTEWDGDVVNSYAPDDCGTEQEKLGDDEEYVARWTADTYNLTYEGLNGATNSNPATYTVETATITLANPGTREGYTFTGWTCGGNAITQITLGSTGDKTITANWSTTTYNLTYEGLEGATNTNPTTYNVESETITLAAPGERSGYAFIGWTINGTPVTEITHGSTGDKTLTANWNAKLSAITLEDNRENSFYNTFKTTYDGAKGVIVTYERQFTAGRWSTLCLPFNVNKTMFSSLNFGSRIYEFKYATGNANDGSGVNLYFSIAKSIEAGKGYIVNADAKLAARTSFTFSGVNIDLSKDNGAELNSVEAYDNLTNGCSSDGNIELVGTLRKGTLKGTAANNRYMGLKDNKIYYPNIATGSTILAYRGIFRSIDGTLNAERIRIIVDGEEKAELEVINGELQDVQETKKFIENGVLYIERNGIIYDATGRKVE